MLTGLLGGILGLVISAVSFVFFILKAMSRKSTGYMKAEMDKFYLGTEE